MKQTILTLLVSFLTGAILFCVGAIPCLFLSPDATAIRIFFIAAIVLAVLTIFPKIYFSWKAQRVSFRESVWFHIFSLIGTWLVVCAARLAYSLLDGRFRAMADGVMSSYRFSIVISVVLIAAFCQTLISLLLLFIEMIRRDLKEQHADPEETSCAQHD